MATARTTTPKTRTLILERGGKGRMKITIPHTNKVTFGMLQPGVRGGHGFGEGSTLRIYEGTKQTAVFSNVIEFRDEAYPVEVEVVEDNNDSNTVFADGEVNSHRVYRNKKSSWDAL